MKTEIIRKASIQELIGHRDRALELYTRASEQFREAERAAALAAPTVLTTTLPRHIAQDIGHSSSDYFVDRARAELDRAVWRSLIDSTGLGDLMDKTARDQFRKGLEDNPPPATVDNCVATCTELVKNAGNIFERSVVSVFERLPYSYRSHDGFKIGARLIFDYANVLGYGFYTSAPAAESLYDLERVFCIMSSQKPPERTGGAYAAIKDAKADGNQECETEFFRLRWYKKGSLHVWFKRDDLLERCNQIIAKHKGETLGAGPDVRNRSHW